MKSRAAGVVLVTGLVGLVAACSGASSSELFGAPGSADLPADPTPGTTNSSGTSGAVSSGGTSGASGSVTSGSSSSSGTSGASSTSSGASGSSSGSTSGSSGTSGSSTSGSTSSSGGTSGASGSSSGSSGWTSPGIFCGVDGGGADVYCPTASKICCDQKVDGSPSFSCVNGGVAACLGGLPIRCDDRTDCPSGQVCCGSYDSQSSSYKSVQCQTSCNSSPIPNIQLVRFCDPAAPVDECAAIGKSCTASGTLTDFYVCK